MIEFPLTPEIGARLLLLARLRAAGGKGSGRYPKGSGGSGKKVSGSNEAPRFVLPSGKKVFDDRPLLHGTSEYALRTILTEGILAIHSGTVFSGQSKEGHVYMSRNEKEAKDFAVQAATYDYEESMDEDYEASFNEISFSRTHLRAAILEIHLPASVLKRLKQDEHGDTTRGARQFKGDIKPEWIKGVRITTGRILSDGSNEWKTIDFKKYREEYRAAETTDEIYYVPWLLIDPEITTLGGPGSGRYPKGSDNGHVLDIYLGRSPDDLFTSYGEHHRFLYSPDTNTLINGGLVGGAGTHASDLEAAVAKGASPNYDDYVKGEITGRGVLRTDGEIKFIHADIGSDDLRSTWRDDEGKIFDQYTKAIQFFLTHGATKDTEIDGAAHFLQHDSGTIGQLLPSFVKKLKAAGGPGSGRYPLGSGDDRHHAKSGLGTIESPALVWRGVRGENIDARIPRGTVQSEGYNFTTYTSNRHLADTYVEYGKGDAQPFTIAAKKVIEFPVTISRVTGGRNFDKFEFDRRARQLGDDEVLVARQVIDSGPWTSNERDPKKLWSYYGDVYAVKNPALVEKGHPRTAGGPGSGRYPKGSGGVELSVQRLGAKYPDVAKRYTETSGTEMGSIGEHTLDVAQMWPKQITHEELASISERWGSDVKKVLDDALALHDIGKSEAIQHGNKDKQHEYTIPIMQDVLTQEGHSQKDIALVTELFNHDLLGKLMQGSPARSQLQIAEEFIAKAARLKMPVEDYVTLQLAFYHADAGAYPYVRNNFMVEDSNGKLSMRDRHKLSTILALVPRTLGGPGSGRYPKGSKTVHSATVQALIDRLGTTENPDNTFFILSDGTRVRGNSYHHYIMAGGKKELTALLDEGVIRNVPHQGAEFATVPTDAQAQLLADDWNFSERNPSHVFYADVGKGTELLGHRSFDLPVTAEAIRNFVKDVFASRQLGGPGSGRYPKGSGGSSFESNTNLIDMLEPLDDKKMARPDSYANGLVQLYHVTSLDAAKSIHREGFRADSPNQFQGFESAHAGVYGWANLERARLEIQRMEDLVPGSSKDFAVIQFQVPAHAWDRLQSDEDQGGGTWKESYHKGLSAVIVGDVPSEWIKGNYVDRRANLKGLGGKNSGRYPKGSGHYDALPDGAIIARSFDFQSIRHRRFLYNPKTNTLVLGAEFPDQYEEGSHGEVLDNLGINTPREYHGFVIRGYIGDNTLRVTEIPDDVIKKSDAVHALYDKILANGANTKTVIDVPGVGRGLLKNRVKTLGGPGSGRYPKGSGTSLSTAEKNLLIKWVQGEWVADQNKMADPSTPQGKAFTAAIEKLPEVKGTFYRGSMVDEVELADLQSDYTLPRHLSATSSEKIARYFTEGTIDRKPFSVIQKFLKSAGRSLAIVEEADSPEQEVVLTAGTKYIHVESKQIPARFENGRLVQGPVYFITYREAKSRTAGGPGSGRYPKGSGDQDDDGAWFITRNINQTIDALPMHTDPVLAGLESKMTPLHLSGISTRSPAWTDDKPAVEAALGNFAQAVRNGKIVEMDIDDLSTYQTFVSSPRMHTLESEGIDYTKPTGVVFDFEGKHWLVDGNHRTALAHLAGRRKVTLIKIQPALERMAAAHLPTIDELTLILEYEPSYLPDNYRNLKMGNPHHDKKGKFSTGDEGGAEPVIQPLRNSTGEGKDLARMKELKLPPAWVDVKLSDDPDAELLATGKDSKGKTQYKYSAKHNADKKVDKFARLKALVLILPDLRKRIEKDLSSDDPAIREAAAALFLISKTGFRIGSDDDTKAAKKAYGATTLQSEHVQIKSGMTSFNFVGKKGVDISKDSDDAKVSEILKPRVKKGGRLFGTNDDKVRKYMHSISNGFTPKDFRTWHGTNEAIKMVKKMPKPTTAKEFKEARKAVGVAVAKYLGNTPTVALADYIDSAVFSSWIAQ